MEFKPKSHGELVNQKDLVENELQTKVSSPSLGDLPLNFNQETLRAQFPLRYEMYLKALRKGRSNEPLSQKEKVEMLKWFTLLNNLDNYIEHHEVNVQDRTLRDKQFDVFQDLRQFLEEGDREGYVRLPTGVGKTVIFSEFVEAIKLRTLIVVPTNILVEQTKDKLKIFATGLDVGVINKDTHVVGSDATIITYASLVSQFKAGKLKAADFDCLILDEAHQALGKETAQVLTNSEFQHTIKIGFTATPKYAENKQVKNILENEIHNLEIKEAVEEGLLCGFRVLIAKTETDISSVKVTSTGDYDPAELDKAINQQARNQSAVRLYEAMFSGQKMVAYCNSISHAQQVAEEFTREGVSAAAIHGEQSRIEQQDLIKKFERGEIKVLTNARILIAGFDDSGVSVGFNLTPTLSPVVAEQRGGRPLRLDPDNPNKFATIVDFLDKSEEEKFPITFVEVAAAAVVPPEYSTTSDHTRRSSPPLPSQDIKILGLEIIVNSDEVLELVRNSMDKKYMPAPEGWMSTNDICAEFHLTPSKVRSMIQSVSIRNRAVSSIEFFDENIRQYRSADGKLRTHYSPNFIEKIKIIIEERYKIESSKWSTIDNIPEGAITREDFIKSSGRARGVVDHAVKKLTGSAMGKREGVLYGANYQMYYTEELAKAIIALLDKKPLAPQGRISFDELVKRLDISREYLSELFLLSGKSIIDDTEHFFSQNNRPEVYVTPQTADILEKKLRDISRIEPGMMSTDYFESLIGQRLSSLSDIQYYKNAIDSQVTIFDRKRGYKQYFTAKEGKLLLEEALGKNPNIKLRNWIYTISDLKRLLGVPEEKLLSIIEKLRARYPMWFIQDQREGTTVEVMHKHLAARISAIIKEPNSKIKS